MDFETLTKEGKGGFWVKDTGEYIPVKEAGHYDAAQKVFGKGGYKAPFEAGWARASFDWDNVQLPDGPLWKTEIYLDLVNVEALKAMRAAITKVDHGFSEYRFEVWHGGYWETTDRESRVYTNPTLAATYLTSLIRHVEKREAEGAFASEVAAIQQEISLYA